MGTVILCIRHLIPLSEVSGRPNGPGITILCRRSAGLRWHVETLAQTWKQRQLYITGDLPPPLPPVRQDTFSNLCIEQQLCAVKRHAGFTSDRSGEGCVFWAPRCDTGFGHPATAAQSSWSKNKHFTSVQKLQKSIENVPVFYLKCRKADRWEIDEKHKRITKNCTTTHCTTAVPLPPHRTKLCHTVLFLYFYVNIYFAMFCWRVWFLWSCFCFFANGSPLKC